MSSNIGSVISKMHPRIFQEAESRIRDLDMAKAIFEYIKTSLCLQAAQTMLSQLFNVQREQVYFLLKSLPDNHRNSY